jgi:3-oxoacyl-[acyl-carrier protein] reductase
VSRPGAASCDSTDVEKARIAQAPLERTGRVGDIVPIAVFLASGDSAWPIGEQLLASCGVR